MGILTVGIVTIPFRFEGDRKIDQALDGVEEMNKHVDALLVINNERLREIYPELTVLDAFGKADDTLSVAAKSIAEIITVHGLINLDFNDVKTVLKDGATARARVVCARLLKTPSTHPCSTRTTSSTPRRYCSPSRSLATRTARTR